MTYKIYYKKPLNFHILLSIQLPKKRNLNINTENKILKIKKKKQSVLYLKLLHENQ